jgi:ribonuclease D
VTDHLSIPILVRGGDGVARCCRDAACAGAVAIDTEADSFHSYHHKLCLIQLSYHARSVVIDPLAVRAEELAPLGALLADPAVTKLMHGADYDLRMFDRDLGFRAVAVRDTQAAAQLLGEPQTGLAALLAKELDVALDKSLQRADWSVRPLTPELLAYAAGDTAHLSRLAAALETRLAALGRLGWWEEECAALEGVRWQAPVRDELAFERVKGARRLRGRARDRLAALHAWREQLAAGDDVAPFRVLGADALLAIAERAPADLEELAKVPGVGSSTVRRRGAAVLQVLAAAPPAPEREPRERFVVDRERERRIKELRSARDARAAELAIDPGVLAPRGGLEAAADRCPDDHDALAACLGRRWRAAELASVLLPIVGGWTAGPDGAEPH